MDFFARGCLALIRLRRSVSGALDDALQRFQCASPIASAAASLAFSYARLGAFTRFQGAAYAVFRARQVARLAGAHVYVLAAAVVPPRAPATFDQTVRLLFAPITWAAYCDKLDAAFADEARRAKAGEMTMTLPKALANVCLDAIGVWLWSSASAPGVLRGIWIASLTVTVALDARTLAHSLLLAPCSPAARAMRAADASFQELKREWQRARNEAAFQRGDVQPEAGAGPCRALAT